MLRIRLEMSGNSPRRRQVKFMPSDFRLQEVRQPPLKDQYDEWLARVICYAFSVPASAFVSQVNRATSETLRMQATTEGLVPLKAWVKTALDHVIQIHLGAPELEFVWVGTGIKTREGAQAVREWRPRLERLRGVGRRGAWLVAAPSTKGAARVPTKSRHFLASVRRL